MPAATLKLKMTACLSGPTKAMLRDLDSVARACNRGRNAAVRAWERWREDHPEWTPEQIVGKDGKPHVNRDGSPRLKNMPMPHKVDDVGGETWVGRAARRAAPDVSSSLMYACASEVWEHLQADVPYNHEGSARYRWQAVLGLEMARDCYRKFKVPVKKSLLALVYGDAAHNASPRVIACGKSSCVLDFPLWSKDAGREVKRCTVRLKVSKLSPGNRALLRRIIADPTMLSDSAIVRKDDQWYFNLCYKVPQEDLHLDKGRVATLEATRGQTYPFKITDPDGKSWNLGHARTVVAQWRRLNIRRAVMKERYRNAGAGVKGHGRKRWYRNLRPATRYAYGLQDDFTKQMVAEIVRFCRQANCGSILYREPPVPSRSKYWFDENSVQFDWTKFQAHLKFRCSVHVMDFSDGKKVKATIRKVQVQAK